MTLLFRIYVPLLCVLFVLFAGSSVPAQGIGGEAPNVPEKVLAEMDWLAGTWKGKIWGGTFVAHYSTPDGGKILGHSKLLRGGEEAFYEFEVFECRETTIHLQPYPGGQKADGFDLVSHSHDAKERRAIFENPHKDYPTRIVYQRVAEDNLVITLSDPHGSSEKVERFDLRR